MKPLYQRLAWLPLLPLLLGGCAANGDRPPASADPSIPALQVVSFVPQPGLAGVMPALAGHRVVFVGENHSRYDHHLAQLMIIRALHQQHPDMAIGLEFFQRPFQPVLDDYIAGRVDEATMLRRSEYYQRWRFDYRLYRPILRYAREQHIPLLALNVPRELTGRIGEVGLDGLSEAERARLPLQMDGSDPVYRQRLQQVFERHNGKTGRAFERFVEVQLAWDEGMAETAADWLQGNPGRHLVVLAGGGHTNQPGGIPDRLRRRMAVDSATVVLDGFEQRAEPRGNAYYLITVEQSLPPMGLLGVMLDVELEPPSITGFSPHSDARVRGVRKGDRIVAIDGAEVGDYTDLKLLLMEREPADVVALEVLRLEPNSAAMRRLRFSVRLN